jgi:hypothetical protein
MTQPGSIIPPQPGWWIRTSKSGIATSVYGWQNSHSSGKIPTPYGAKPRILLPNMSSRVYPVLMPLRQAMAGGKIFTRPPMDEYGDPGRGALTSIWIPRPEHPTYPLFPVFRLGMRSIHQASDFAQFDSIGAGASSLGSTWSWSQTLGTAANALLVHLYLEYTSAPGALTVKIGSTTIPQLVSITPGTLSGITTYVQTYVILNPPVGVQSMSATLGSGTVYMAINSVAYRNVSGFGTPVTNIGISTSLSSGSVSAKSPQMISHMFGAGLSSLDTLSGYSGTSRSSIPAVSGQNGALLIGDTPGNVGVNLTATGSPSDYWGSIAVPLLTSR